MTDFTVENPDHTVVVAVTRGSSATRLSVCATPENVVKESILRVVKKAEQFITQSVDRAITNLAAASVAPIAPAA
ncbi:MAG: hypothetical protein AAF471_03875 [Myxococcota bacterium]